MKCVVKWFYMPLTKHLDEHHRVTVQALRSGIPVSLIQDEHFNAAQVERRAVVQVVDEPARCGNEDVWCCPKSSFLRLHIQATCREQTPQGMAWPIIHQCYFLELRPNVETHIGKKTRFLNEADVFITFRLRADIKTALQN